MGCPFGPDVKPAAKKHPADMGCLYGPHEATKMPIWVLLWVHMGMLAGHSVVTLGRPFMTRTDPRRRAISAGENGSPQMRWAAYVLTRWAPCPIGHWAPRVKKKRTQLKN